jgi:hypothetical protein
MGRKEKKKLAEEAKWPREKGLLRKAGIIDEDSDSKTNSSI